MNIKLLKFRIRTSITAIIKTILHAVGVAFFGIFIRSGKERPFIKGTDSPKILFISIGYRGDFILNFPILKAIKVRYPNAHITCWVRGYSESLAKLNPYIDNSLVYDEFPNTGFHMIWKLLHINRRDPFIKSIGSMEFDFSIDDSGYGFSADVCYLAAIPYRIGRNIQGFGFLNHYEVPSAPNSNLLDKRLRLLEPLGISVPHSGDLYPSISIPKSKLEELNKKYGLNIRAGDYFTIQPYGGWEAKNWDDEKFTIVIREFGNYSGKTPVFIGGPTDIEGISRIKDKIGFACIETAGKIDLGEAAILISGAAIHLGVDSFGSQFAAAAGVKSLTLFGPTNPRLILFMGPENKAVMKKTSCSPRPDRLYCCADAGRSCPRLSCMKELQVDHVLGPLQALWKGDEVEDLIIY